MITVHAPSRETTTVSLVTLGCARNEVDSSELAAHLQVGGYQLVSPGQQADVVVVNTCAFIASAKKDSIDALLEAASTGAKVVAVGCLAERYGDMLAKALPEADAVVGFQGYPKLAEFVEQVTAGQHPRAQQPADRRMLLPIAPVDRPAAAAQTAVPGHGVDRLLLTSAPVAPVKIASGCDRRCTFCAIPSFRGSFLSRPINHIVAEAAELADRGITEIVLVSENTTSYGKDLPGKNLLTNLLRELAGIKQLRLIRLSYLQPAETTPALIEAIASTPKVAPYFDMSFQHASTPVLRRMRRFGSPDTFAQLLDTIRQVSPSAGIRSNFIVGFPGESEADFAALTEFVGTAQLDAVGIFGYSDEDGTAAAELDGKIDEDVIASRVELLTDLADAVSSQRARARIGTSTTMLVDACTDAGAVGHTVFQAHEVDGSCTLVGAQLTPGELVPVLLTGSDGVDLFGTVQSGGGAP